ncbi:MAG: biotin/lipoyl-containing protein [Chloroflexota bacterium]|nr:acetyl-CoA carboxylase biotin carboxyl carrier protein subunit [Lentimicrobium sp.]
MEGSKESQEIRTIVIDNVKYKTRLTKKYLARKMYSTEEPGKVYSFIPGTILKVSVKPGDKVKKGTHLLELEAMKMANNIVASIDGTVLNVYVKQGDLVPKNFLLAEIG